MRVNIFVNGYGAPRDPVCDGNLTRYLGAVIGYIKKNPEDDFYIFLAGGYTNREDMSEAHAMWLWLMRFTLGLMSPANICNIFLIEDSTTARDNLRLYSQMVAHNVPSVFFFEHSRRPHMVFLAKKFFTNRKYRKSYKFIGVPFDAKSLKLTNRAKVYLLKYPLLVLSWYFPFIDRYIVKPIRKRHVAKCRQEAEMDK